MTVFTRKLKPKHKNKFFGFSNEKWAKYGTGDGRSKKFGYGRHYGLNLNGGHHIDFRTRAEKRNADDIRIEKLDES